MSSNINSNTPLSGREKFESWLVSPENEKKNTTIMTKNIYDEIVNYLHMLNSGKSVKSLDRKIEKRVKFHKYDLMNYPTLGLKDVLCVPCKGNKVRTFLI